MGQEARETMSVMESLRKGLKFFLMSFGVSSPDKKPGPAKGPTPPEEPRK
jgi:hypothetical protein